MLDNNFSSETAHLFPMVFRHRAADAIMEFDEALRELVGAGTITARERLRDASDQLMQILARVLIETD
ncbi:MAG: hypothetical protein JWL84_4411 [Rhodospirillales bacterium]|jgi:hypothetical protein|nr:hypothetical protein [Rhodospirillales bacterium]